MVDTESEYKKKKAISGNEYEEEPPLLYDPIMNLIGNLQQVSESKYNPSLTGLNKKGINGSSGENISSIVNTEENAISHNFSLNGTNALAEENAVSPNLYIIKNAQSIDRTASLNAYASEIQKGLEGISSQEAAAQYSAGAISNAIEKLGPLTGSEFSTLSYSSGLTGYSVVPTYNAKGEITGATVVNTAKSLSNSNPIETTPNPENTYTYSANGIVSSTPNTTVGYTSVPNTGTTVPVYSQGSGFHGAGEYINSAGSYSYIGSESQYNQQKAIGSLGTSTTTSVNTAPIVVVLTSPPNIVVQPSKQAPQSLSSVSYNGMPAEYNKGSTQPSGSTQPPQPPPPQPPPKSTPPESTSVSTTAPSVPSTTVASTSTTTTTIPVKETLPSSGGGLFGKFINFWYSI
ncbi:MAG: hypothetical protein ACP5MB_06390 [bacterium]